MQALQRGSPLAVSDLGDCDVEMPLREPCRIFSRPDASPALEGVKREGVYLSSGVEPRILCASVISDRGVFLLGNLRGRADCFEE